jgi:hypothetical protein
MHPIETEPCSLVIEKVRHAPSGAPHDPWLRADGGARTGSTQDPGGRIPTQGRASKITSRRIDQVIHAARVQKTQRGKLTPLRFVFGANVVVSPSRSPLEKTVISKQAWNR